MRISIRMKQKQIDSLFSVGLTLYDDGRVELKDVQGNVYEIRNKDDTVLTALQYEDIVNKQLSYWSIVKRYKLIVLQEANRE